MNNEEILKELEQKIKKVTNLNELNDVKIEYLSKKGIISSLTSKLSSLPVEEKKSFGAKLNELKDKASTMIEEKRSEIETKLLNEKLNNESIDIHFHQQKYLRVFLIY